MDTIIEVEKNVNPDCKILTIYRIKDVNYLYFTERIY